MSSLSGLTNGVSRELLEAKRDNSPRSSSPANAARDALAIASNTNQTIRSLASGVIQIRLINPYHDSISFKERFKLYLEVINSEFVGANLNFSDEQIACIELISKHPLYEIRPLAETVGVSLFQDFKKLHARVGELGWSPAKVKIVRDLLAPLKITHGHFGWIENMMNLDEVDSNSRESSEALRQDVMPPLKAMEKVIDSISKMPARDIEFNQCLADIKAKISVMKSMIKLDRSDSGKIFWLGLGSFEDGVNKIMEERSLIESMQFEALHGAVDSNLLREACERYERDEMPEDRFKQYIVDLLEWQTPAYKYQDGEDMPIVPLLNRAKELVRSLPQNCAEVENFLHETCMSWKTRIEEIDENANEVAQPDEPVFSIYDHMGIEAYINSYRNGFEKYSLTKAQTLLLAIKFVIQNYFKDKSHDVRLIKFQTTLRSFFSALDRFEENSEKRHTADFYQLMQNVFLEMSGGFVEKGRMLLESSQLSQCVDFCKKAQFYFAKPAFESALPKLHKKYSEIASRLAEKYPDEAEQLSSEYTNLCLEFANLYLLVQMIDNERHGIRFEISLDVFFDSLPTVFLDCLELDILPLQPIQEEPSNNRPVGVINIEDGSPEPLLELPPSAKREKVKTRGPSAQVEVSSHVQKVVAPAPQEPAFKLTSSREIKRDHALKLLRQHFGEIEVVEGRGDHSKVLLPDGGSLALPRHRRLSTVTVEKAVEQVLKKKKKGS